MHLIGTLIMWLVVGFLAGLLAKAIVPGPAEKPSGFLGTAILGIVGAIVGGFIYHLITRDPSFVTRFDLMSILWAALGAVIVVAIERAIAGRRAI